VRRELLPGVVILVAALAVFLWRVGEGPIDALETPAVRPAPEVFEAARPAPEQDEDPEEPRVGNFERPEHVPAYEILEESPTGSGGIRSARLLVDTRARSQEDFTLITRDLKVRYADYDFVSVEFTDLSVVLDYQGGAVIVNTPVGSRRAGFIYAPPDHGYYVRAAD
jgi:hypothetical protein